MPAPIANPIPKSRGSILLLVLVAVVALTLGTGAYLALMQGEHRAVRRHGRQALCTSLAKSGIAYAQVLLAKTDESLAAVGGPFQNTTNLCGALVIDAAEPMDRGRFSVIAPTMVDGIYSGWTYGFEDESSKLHLNSLVTAGETDEEGPRNRLLALPGMTVEIADAILDWLDADSNVRVSGAEDEYYQGLNPPYLPANGPIGHLDELLQIRGVTPELLYGIDQNRNFAIDPGETPRGMLAELDNSTGEITRGWAAYLTVDGVESFPQASGGKRINLNGPNLQTLYSELGQVLTDEQAKFLILMRQYGAQQNLAGGQGQPPDGGPGGQRGGGQQPGAGQPSIVQSGGEQPGGGRQGRGGDPRQGANMVSAAAVQLDFQRQPAANIGSLLDVVGATVQIAAEGSPPQTVTSPWQEGAGYAELMKLYDAATAAPVARVGGRINVNRAPRAVLRSIPGIDAATIEQIVMRRDGVYDPIAGPRRHAVWLLVESVVDLATMRALEPYVTGDGSVFSAQVLGYFDAGNDLARFHVVVDRSAATPQVVRIEDLAPLGRGFRPTAVGAQESSP
ncbi:MAG: general secretion pathway protein GspK [Pirellulales bacterium]|nr:general secretion pathway protein GspK [Pirellulales bacterium]